MNPIRTVLLLEDNPSLAEMFTKIVRKAGYEVFTTTSLENARVLLRHISFDVFLCDMRLGDGYGIDLLIEQQAILYANHTRVIVISAEDQFREACAAVGVEFYLEKPVSPRMLTDLLSRLGQPSPTIAALSS